MWYISLEGYRPTALCSAERSFSALRRLKTYLLSTRGNNEISHLLKLKGHMPTL